MICWEAQSHPEEGKKIPISRLELIGWDDNLNSHPNWNVIWQVRDGRVELPPPRRACSTRLLRDQDNKIVVSLANRLCSPLAAI